MREVIWENLFKNFVIAALLVPSYFAIGQFFQTNYLVQDKSVLGSILTSVSIIAVTACFGNFAFTYEKVVLKNAVSRWLAHITTALLMLLIGLSLEMTSAVLHALVGDFLVFDASLLLLYLASVLYDFWDLNRISLQ